MRPVLLALLVFAAAAFSLDLFHMSVHLAAEPRLWTIEGVPGKLALKIFTLAAPLFFLFTRKRWMTFLFLLLFGMIPAARAGSGCEHARELMNKSGMARDAKENFFGRLKISPPETSFPSAMDKITWWGDFEPFEFWEHPEFRAAWIDPSGRETAVQTFTGTKCRLAKTTLKGEAQSGGEFMPGTWRVVVTCGEYMVDQQTFAVLPEGGKGPVPSESASGKNDGFMIWAKDKV